MARNPLRKSRTRPNIAARRRFSLEKLEDRSMMAVLPYGAQPDDTGEFMLGKVHVTVVLMESTPSLSPGDNGSVVITPPSGAPYIANYIPENWTPALIQGVKDKVTEATNWWEQTLDSDPNVRDGLLDFQIDFTYADSPVPTGYEPIARRSNDFAHWVYDFLSTTGLPVTGNYNADIRSFNNYQRERTGSDWAFTLFVVNDTNDTDKRFDPSGSFQRSFAFAGGRFAVMLASRPASIFAHEIGHQFWALDEYAGLGNYSAARGYYNTPNSNSAENPTPGFIQQDSLMASDPGLTAAYLNFTTSTASKEMIGWKDSDGNGIFDVLDVPFSLSGTGRYNDSTGLYSFRGRTSVETLPNLNASGNGNDITINKIRVAEYAIDDGPWQVAQTFNDTYETNLQLEFAVPAGEHTIRIRTHDTVTGVTSPVFYGSTSGASSQSESGISGFVYRDTDQDAYWDSSENPLMNWLVRLVDEQGNPLQLAGQIEPNDYANGQSLTAVGAGMTLSVRGGDSDPNNRDVVAFSSLTQPAAGKVFAGFSPLFGSLRETWSSARQLRIDFDSPQSFVSLRALGSGVSSYGRLEAYNSSGELVDRYTTGALSGSSAETMSITRATGDIAYVIARGHLNTEVVLDTLNVGPQTSTYTDSTGAYFFENLPAGSYTVSVQAPSTYIPTTQEGNTQTATVTAGVATSDVTFGFAAPGNPWHNYVHDMNVNNDTRISVFDALLVINYLNINGTQSLPAVKPDGEFFYDVSNDGRVSVYDALLVINYLNINGTTPAIGGESEPDDNDGDDDGGSSGGDDDDGGTSGTIITLPGGPADGDDDEGEGEAFEVLFDIALTQNNSLSAEQADLAALISTDTDDDWLANGRGGSLASYLDLLALEQLADPTIAVRRIKR